MPLIYRVSIRMALIRLKRWKIMRTCGNWPKRLQYIFEGTILWMVRNYRDVRCGTPVFTDEEFGTCYLSGESSDYGVHTHRPALDVMVWLEETAEDFFTSMRTLEDPINRQDGDNSESPMVLAWLRRVLAPKGPEWRIEVVTENDWDS